MIELIESIHFIGYFKIVERNLLHMLLHNYLIMLIYRYPNNYPT